MAVAGVLQAENEAKRNLMGNAQGGKYLAGRVGCLWTKAGRKSVARYLERAGKSDG